MDTNKDDLRIIELRGENFKKIKAIVIRPDDDLVLLTGKNAQGKSSAIDLIISMLCGKNSKLIPQPIRKGQAHADGRLDLEEFIVNCKWTEKGKYLKVTSREGLVYPSPQAMLDEFIGRLGFDIGKFFNMDSKEQTKILQELAELDFTEVDAKIDRLVEERRMQGQKVKLLSGQREVINPEMVPKELVSTSKLNEELERANENNYEMERAKNLHRSISGDITTLVEEIRVKQKSLSEIENDMKGKKIIPTDILKSKIKGAEEGNEIFRANERNKTQESNFKKEENIYYNQTTAIEGLRKNKEFDLQEAKLPLPELKINTSGTFFNDIPIEQLSSSERMKVAMSIAMALNERFKVILVKDASLLDKDNLGIIRGMAKDGGYQVWLEMVSDTGEMGFYFVDGEIESINGEKQDRIVDAEFKEEEVEDGN